MHAGRVAHPDNTGRQEIIAPSAIAAPGEMFTADGPKPHPVPRALATDEIPERRPGVRHRRPQRGRGRAGRGRDPRRQRLPDPPVPRPGQQPARRRVRRHAGEPCPLRHRGHPRRGRRDRRRQGRDPDLARPTTSRARPRRTPPTSARPTPPGAADRAARPGLPVDPGRARPRPGAVAAQGVRRRRHRQRRLRRDDHQGVRAGDPRRGPRRRGRHRPAVPRQPRPPAPLAEGAELNEPTRRPSTAAAPRATPTTRPSPTADPRFEPLATRWSSREPVAAGPQPM